MKIDRTTLLENFHQYGRPKSGWLVGGEFERAMVRPTGEPIGYFEPFGVRWILEQLAKNDSWTPKYEGEHLIALHKKNGANITLEPGGQVELSGAPHRTLSALAEEMQTNREELLQLAEGKNQIWIAAGLTPIAPINTRSAELD